MTGDKNHRLLRFVNRGLRALTPSRRHQTSHRHQQQVSTSGFRDALSRSKAFDAAVSTYGAAVSEHLGKRYEMHSYAAERLFRDFLNTHCSPADTGVLHPVTAHAIEQAIESRSSMAEELAALARARDASSGQSKYLSLCALICTAVEAHYLAAGSDCAGLIQMVHRKNYHSALKASAVRAPNRTDWEDPGIKTLLHCDSASYAEAARFLGDWKSTAPGLNLDMVVVLYRMLALDDDQTEAGIALFDLDDRSKDARKPIKAVWNRAFPVVLQGALAILERCRSSGVAPRRLAAR